MENVRVDCYLAKLKKFKSKYPNAHFEVITRTAKSILSPSWKLLTFAKELNLPFEEYKKLFLKEMYANPKALERIDQLKQIAKDKPVFLICYEKDWNICHRSIIKLLINSNLTKTESIEVR